MTQEDKEFLLRDLCGRLPYGVKCEWYRYRPDHELIHRGIIELGKNSKDTNIFDNWNKFKPYLFPLSSMTEEQEKEISERYNYHNYFGLSIEITYHSEGYWDNDTSCNLQDYLWLEDWFNKNHFDYRGLIEKGLAIDATNLNVY